MENIKRLGRRLTANYALIQCIYNMSYCSIMSFASVFLLSRGFTNSQVGMTLTIGSGLAILCQPIIAAFADKTNKVALRNIVATMMMFLTAFSFLLHITPSIVLPTMILYIILICFQSTQSSLITSMSMEHINSGIPLNYSLARGIGSFAFAMLSFFMGFLVDDFGAWIIMPVNMGIGIVGIIFASTFRKAEKPQKSTDAEIDEKALGFVEFAKKNARFMAVAFSVALLFFSHILINSYTIQIIKNVGGSSSDMGIASAIGGFLELPAMALFPQILKRMKSAGTIMKLSGVFLVIKTLITLLAPNVFWVNVAQCFQFFAYAMFIPSSVYYANRIISGVDKVKAQAFMGISMNISGMIGNFLGGFMLDTSGGVSFMLTVGVVISFVGLVMLILIAPRDREKVIE